MEKTLKPYDKEFMRAAILKHDQIFKEQVHELHRLYRVQKILMNGAIQTNNQLLQPSNHKQNSQGIDINSVHGRSNNNNCRSTHVDTNINGMFGSLGCSPHMEEGEIELTLGLGPASSNYNNNSTSSSRRETMDQKKTLPSMTTSAGGRRRQSPSSSSSTGSSQAKKTTTTNTAVVLTKQQNIHGTRLISDELVGRQLTWGFLQGGNETDDHHMSFQNGGNISSANDGATDKINHRGDHEQHLRQQPTWLFQALSLKLT